MARDLSCYQRLDIATKNQLIGAIKVSGNISEVASDNNVPRTTLNTLWQKFNETGTIEDRPKSGRPFKLKDRGERRLLNMARQSCRMPLGELGNQSIPSVCEQTARRTLARFGYHRRKARRVPFLTPVKKDRRITIARELKATPYITADTFTHIIWSDECYVQLGDTPGSIYVMRLSGKAYDEGCTIPTFKESSVRVMVWACVMRGRKGPLVVLDYPGGKGGGMNSDRYITQVLEGVLLDFYLDMVDERAYILFQQDGASCHQSKRTLGWLDDHGIPLLPHPPSSPDLNPIEPVWADLKRLIRAHPHHPSSAAELIQAVQKAWAALSVDDIDKHTGSFARRIDAVIEAKGGNTRY